MEWTQQMLARYLGRVRLVVEFQGLRGGELSAALKQEGLRRLKQVEAGWCSTAKPMLPDDLDEGP